jgi:hypothetical protein
MTVLHPACKRPAIAGNLAEAKASSSPRPGDGPERIVETLVLAIHEIPKDAHLRTLMQSGDFFAVSSALKLAFVQEEMLALSDGALPLDARERDELAEILLRLLNSFLADPGPERNEEELRAFLLSWLVPLIEDKLHAAAPA